MPDIYDEQAAIIGEAAGLRFAQWSGLAHILRQTAAAEREACAALADEFRELPHGSIPAGGLEATREAARQIAEAIRNRSN